MCHAHRAVSAGRQTVRLRAPGRIARAQIGAGTGTGLWAGKTWEGFDMSDYLLAIPSIATGSRAGAKAALDAAAVRVRSGSSAILSARHGGVARKEWD